MNDDYTILEVANLLEITTQAVYKRLQQDIEVLRCFGCSTGGRKALKKEGVIELSKLMGLENPFEEEEPTPTNVEETEINPGYEELLNYLRTDNEKLQKEIEELKLELTRTRNLWENDLKNRDEERRQHEEARMRSDALLMKAMMNQEKPRLLDRIFRKDKKKNKDKAENPDLFSR